MWYPMAETGDTGESIEHSARATPLKLERLPVTQEAAGSSPAVPAISARRIKLLCYPVSLEVPVGFKLVCRKLDRWPGQGKHYDRE